MSLMAVNYTPDHMPPEKSMPKIWPKRLFCLYRHKAMTGMERIGSSGFVVNLCAMVHEDDDHGSQVEVTVFIEVYI